MGTLDRPSAAQMDDTARARHSHARHPLSRLGRYSITTPAEAMRRMSSPLLLLGRG